MTDGIGDFGGDGGVGAAKALTLTAANTIAVGQDAPGDWQLLTSIDASATKGAVWIAGATSGAGSTNSTVSGTNPDGLFGSTTGLLDEGTGVGGGTFALTSVKLGTGKMFLDASAATAAQIAALKTTGAVVAGNEIVVAGAVADTASFANIAGFDTLGVAAAAGIINMTNLPSTITTINLEAPATGDVTIDNGVNNLTVNFLANSGVAAHAYAIDAAGTGSTATLNLGNATLATGDTLASLTTTDYTVVNIGSAGALNTINGAFDLKTSLAADPTHMVNISGGADITFTGGVTDVPAAGAPPSGTDTINVTGTGTVDLGTTNFGIVKAAPSAGLTVVDTYFNSTIIGSATGDNNITGGDGGGVPGTGNTITGGPGSDTITTGLGANTINLGATHVTDIVTIGSGFGGVITSPGDQANAGSWGLAFGTAPSPATDIFTIFGGALSGSTSASQTVIKNFNVAAGSTDLLQFQAKDWDTTAAANSTGGIDHGLQIIDLTGHPAAGPVVTESATSGGAFTPGANFIELPVALGLAGASGLATALQSSFDLKTGPLATKDDAHLLVAYSNSSAGGAIEIADVALYNTGAASTSSMTDHVYASDMVQLTGVTTFTALAGHVAFV